MKFRRARNTILMSLCLIGLVATVPRTSGAQAASPGDAAAQSSSSGRTVLANVGAVAGSIVYAPFKALVLCPVSAIASGAVYAVTRGTTDTPDYVLRLGCTGTYFISPAMVQGEEAFRRYDER
jgi:hypothetical protein